MATHSNTHAWEVPWTEGPGGLQSVGLVARSWPRLSTHAHNSLCDVLQGAMPYRCIYCSFIIVSNLKPRQPSKSIPKLRTLFIVVYLPEDQLFSCQHINKEIRSDHVTFFFAWEFSPSSAALVVFWFFSVPCTVISSSQFFILLLLTTQLLFSC